MKKRISNRIISFIIVISIVTSILCINVYASEEESPFLDTYAANYFHRLTNNFGRNTNDSCGFVAAGMLLSFYDSYLSDSFIPENYDAEGELDYTNLSVSSSPGISREINWKNFSTYENYEDFIDEKAEDFFHLRLLQIGRDQTNICDPNLKDWMDLIFQERPIETDWIISINNIKTLIDTYISRLSEESNASNPSEEINKIKNNTTVNVMSFLDLENIFDSNPNETIREEMIDKIKAGIPVIYFGCSESALVGHFLIAYDYDEENDEIYFHTGWGNPTFMTDKDTDFVYTTKTSILWIEFDEDELTHSHSNNYVDFDTGDTLCACQIYSEHPEHDNNHLFINEGYNNKKHYLECHCGQNINATYHTLSLSCLNSTQHYEECRDCVYSGVVSHTYNVLCESSSSEGHNLACICGQVSSAIADHYYSTYERYTTTKHKTYCACGYYMGAMAHVVPTTGFGLKICIYCGERIDTSIIITPVPGTNSVSMRYITEAGSYVDANGIIYLVPSDLELVMAGELDVYALVENGGDLVTQ